MGLSQFRRLIFDAKMENTNCIFIYSSYMTESVTMKLNMDNIVVKTEDEDIVIFGLLQIVLKRTVGSDNISESFAWTA